MSDNGILLLVWVKCWHEWYMVGKSLNPKVYKLYKDGFCVGCVAERNIQHIKVLSVGEKP